MDNRADRIRALVLAVSGTFAGTTVVFIVAFLGLTPHGLDEPLHRALFSFAVALPLLVFSAQLSYLRVAGALAYFVCGAGVFLLEYGVFEVFNHLDPTVAKAFTLAVLACNSALLYLAFAVARHAKKYP